MPSFNATPSSGQLREMFPEIAASLEAIVVKHNAHKLGINFKTKSRSRSLTLEIPLTHNHLMRISPVDKGPGGISEFFSFVKKAKSIDPRRHKILDFEILETIRVHVEIFEVIGEEQKLVFSHTLHEETLERVIRGALEGVYQTKNLRLSPIERCNGARHSKLNNGPSKDQTQKQLKLDLDNSNLDNEEEGDC